MTSNRETVSPLLYSLINQVSQFGLKIQTVNLSTVCCAWESAADTNLIKLQRLQNKVLRTIGNYPRRTPIHELHLAFHIPFVYDYITQLCRQQAEVIQNHDNENVRIIDQGEARHNKYKRLKLGGGQAYDRSSV
jgi:hypothetical protein